MSKQKSASLKPMVTNQPTGNQISEARHSVQGLALPSVPTFAVRRQILFSMHDHSLKGFSMKLARLL